MKTKKFLLTLLALVMLLTGCGGKGKSTAKTDGKPIELKMAQASAQDGAIGQSMEEFAKKVEEKTNGEVKIVLFHNGQMGTERDNVEAVQLNNLDIAVVNNSVLANFIPWFSVFDLPYVIENEEEADKVFLGDIGEDMKKSMSDIGIKGISIWESGFRNLTNSKREINSVNDVEGLRIRVMENKIHQALWQALGADPVPMSWSDAYTGMQQGAIDGQENPTTVIDKNNVIEVNKNLAITKHVYSTVSIIMSNKVWDSLGEENQKNVMDCMKEVEKNERDLSRKMELEARNTLEKNGMKVTEPNIKEFVEKTKSVRDEYGKEYKDILDKIGNIK